MLDIQARIKPSDGAEICERFYTSPQFPPSTVARWTRQAFIAQKTFGINDVRASLIECSSRLLVVFRGTVFANKASALRNLDADLSPEQGRYHVHAGYQRGLNEVWNELTDAIWGAQSEKRRPITYVGHSAGAALATICGVRSYVEWVSGDRANACCRPDQILSYASPRVGDSRFAELVEEIRKGGVAVQRFTASNDIVPRVPLARQGFKHGAPELYLNRVAVIKENPWWLYRQFDSLAQRLATPTLFDSVYAHSINNYRNLLIRNKQQQRGAVDA